MCGGTYKGGVMSEPQLIWSLAIGSIAAAAAVAVVTRGCHCQQLMSAKDL